MKAFSVYDVLHSAAKIHHWAVIYRAFETGLTVDIELDIPQNWDDIEDTARKETNIEYLKGLASEVGYKVINSSLRFEDP